MVVVGAHISRYRRIDLGQCKNKTNSAKEAAIVNESVLLLGTTEIEL